MHMLLLAVMIGLNQVSVVNAFALGPLPLQQGRRASSPFHTRLFNAEASSDSDEQSDDNNRSNDGDDNDWKHFIGGDGLLFDNNNSSEQEAVADLSWRVAKLRLEEQNTRRFLKAKPRFLPYRDCRQWVMAWSRWKTKDDWRHWISQGEKKNSYIPSMPDVYYRETGDWRGWDHFLGVGGDEEEKEGNEFQ